MKISLKNKLSNYAIYWKMLVSFIFLLAMAITVISITLFSLFSSSAIKEINNVSQAMLTQTSYSSDVVYEQAVLVGTQLVSDPSYIAAMTNKDPDNILDYHIIQQMSSLQAVYPFINYISIYNGKTDRMLSKKWGVSSALDKNIIHSIQKSSSSSYMEFIPRKVKKMYNSNNQEYQNMLSFVFYPNFMHKNAVKSAVIINIYEIYFQNIIRSISSNSDDNIFVINSQGAVLSHTRPELFLEDFSKYEYIQEILSSSSPKGYSISNINGQRQLVTYVKSDKLNWVFVSVKPFYAQLTHINQLRYITLIITIVLLAIGIILSLYLTNILYNPLKSLMNKIGTLAGGNKAFLENLNEYDFISNAFSTAISDSNSLKISLQTTYPLLKETYMRFLLNGNLEDVTGTIEAFHQMEHNFKGPCFCVMVLKIDNYLTFKADNTEKDQALWRFAICNITQELIGKTCKNDSVSIDRDELALLVQLESNKIPDGILLALNEAQDCILSNFNISLTLSIGDIVLSKNDINQSYESAVEYGNYRLFYGKGCIIDYNWIKNHLICGEEYPHAIEKKLLEAIQLNNAQTIEKEIENFIVVIRSTTYNHALAYFNQLLISINESFYDTVYIISKNDPKYMDLSYSLTKFETLNEISSVITDFCIKICGSVEEKRSNKNLQLIQEVKDYMDINYHSPNLSLGMIAGKVHLSTGYLGKIFKVIASMPFNDYLNIIRLEKARELLMSTNEPASVICEKVGIYNSTYFSTLFKKTFGLTPSQYRNQFSKE